MSNLFILPSRFQIGDTVSYHHTTASPSFATTTHVNGTVVAVKFTESKVRYDVLVGTATYTDIDSEYIDVPIVVLSKFYYY